MTFYWTLSPKCALSEHCDVSGNVLCVCGKTGSILKHTLADRINGNRVSSTATSRVHRDSRVIIRPISLISRHIIKNLMQSFANVVQTSSRNSLKHIATILTGGFKSDSHSASMSP